jgi:hypothetical protein
MRLEMRSDVFGLAEALPSIIGLLACIQEGRHIWAPDSETIASASRYLQEHLPSLADGYITLARKGLVELQWTSAGEKPEVVVVDAANLSELTDDLRRAAVVVVEDCNSDGSFFEALSKVFRADRVLLALSSGWLEIRHGGGSGSLPSVAMTEIAHFRRKIRVAVMFDSDRLLPGQSTPAHAKAETLADAGALVHVLEFREIENYLPNRVLAAVLPARVSAYRLGFLKHLSAEQRAFYDMKSGFGPASGPPQVPLEQAPLFASLPHSTIRGLRGGFGKNVVSKFALMAASVTVRDFESLGTTVVAEISAILSKVAQIV